MHIVTMIDWRRDLWAAGILAGAIAIALIVHFILFFILKRLASRKGDVVITSLVRHSQGPSLWILPLLALLVALPTAPLPQRLSTILEHIVGLGLIATIAWLVILFSQILSDVLASAGLAGLVVGMAMKPTLSSLIAGIQIALTQ